LIRALILALAGMSLWAADFKIRLTAADGGAVVSLPLEKYVAGVLVGEASILSSDEAIKAMAVAARTYAVRLRGRHSLEGFDFCGTTHCQRIDLRGASKRFDAIAGETAGELLWFEGKPAFACYTRDCGGFTEDGGAAWPGLSASYLKSHNDPYCPRSGASAWNWVATTEAIAEALRQSQLRFPAQFEQITISERSASGRARTLVLSGGGETVAISASSFRFAMGRTEGWNTLRSDRYEVRAANHRLIFQGTGAGHGAGLCQLGAEQMGREGRSYRDILTFYYPGTMVGITGRGLRWVRLGGESTAMFTTQPDQDHSVLAEAERFSRIVSERTKLPLPVSIEIRVYPDVDTFRNATGEPGWVAARTTGTRIHLQPAAVLRSRGVLEETLAHELLHVLVESQAARGLPVWFREGLTGYFEHSSEASQAAATSVDDADLRQQEDPTRARLAYAQATRRVADLVNRYGEGAVLGWLKRGLPAELKNTASSHAPMKSR